MQRMKGPCYTTGIPVITHAILKHLNTRKLKGIGARISTFRAELVVEDLTVPKQCDHVTNMTMSNILLSDIILMNQN